MRIIYVLVSGAEHPSVMSQLKARLVQLDKEVVQIGLKGFDSDPEALKAARPGFWEEALAEELASRYPISNDSVELFLVGHSLGANSCIRVASLQGSLGIAQIKAVVGLNTAFTLVPFDLSSLTLSMRRFKLGLANLFTEHDLARFSGFALTNWGLKWIFGGHKFPTHEIYLERMTSAEARDESAGYLSGYVYPWWPTQAIAAFLHEREELITAAQTIADKLFLFEGQDDVLCKPCPSVVSEAVSEASGRNPVVYTGTHFLPVEVAHELAGELDQIEKTI